MVNLRWHSGLRALLAAACLLAGPIAAHATDAATHAASPSVLAHALPLLISDFAADVVRVGDAGGRPFSVIDKPSATLWVFDARGQAMSHTPVLVGQARGDVAPSDIGNRPLSKVRPHEKITTAGRYLSEGGRNHQGEDIVWLDYDSALSMHRVRNVPGEARAHRLATPTVADNRISFGCVNIPASFYDRYIDPLFSRSAGVVYVLPETKPIASVFPFATRTRVQQAAMDSTPRH